MERKVKKVKRPLSYERKKQLYGFMFILPWLLGAIFFFFRPFIYSFYYSVQFINLADGVNMSFVGLRYYRDAFVTDPEYLPRLAAALALLAYEVPLIMVFSLGIALVLAKGFRGSAFFKSLFFLPVIIASGVVIQIVRGDALAKSMTDATAASSLMQVRSMMDILFALNIPYDAINVILVVTGNIYNLTWKSGIQILIFIAAIKSVSPQLYEASSIEGATSWEEFWKITLPLISPMIIANLVYTIADSFTDYSNGIVNYIQKYAQQGALGLSFSAAMSIVYFFIIFIVMAVVYLIVNRYVFYYND
jgi:ABC-type sugar transport system permease subunit